MTDESNMQEIPKDKVPPESLAQTFERLRVKTKPNKGIPQHFLKETDPELNETPPTQEELFRNAAIECAQLEEELVGMFDQLPWRSTLVESCYSVEAEEGVDIERAYGNTSITSYEENIRGLDEKPVRVSFSFGKYMDREAKRLGFNTDRQLSIWFHGDESTREEYERVTGKNPGSLDAIAITDYNFTEDGKHMKTLNMSASVPVDPKRKPYDSTGDRVHYESDMTPSDFEIAKGTLSMFKERLQKIIGDSNTSL